MTHAFTLCFPEPEQRRAGRLATPWTDLLYVPGPSFTSPLEPGTYRSTFVIVPAEGRPVRVSSFVVPRYKPDFPGPAGLSVFAIASIVMFALMIAAMAFSGLRINSLEHESYDGELKVAMVQGNIPQSIKWDPNFRPSSFKVYVDQTLRAAIDWSYELLNDAERRVLDRPLASVSVVDVPRPLRKSSRCTR